MNCYKRLRKETGLTQKELAELLGIRQQSVAAWEEGRCLPAADKLPKIAKIFNCEVSDLFDKEVG